jgi:hypothetical protein
MMFKELNKRKNQVSITMILQRREKKSKHDKIFVRGWSIIRGFLFLPGGMDLGI